MDGLREVSRWIHIVLGFAGLAAFWVPILAKKGSRLHVLSGKVFVACGYGVAVTAAISCAVLALGIVRDGAVSERRDDLGFLLFLTYLALVTFAALRHAVQVVKTRHEPATISTKLHRGLAYACIVASGAVVAYALALPSRVSLLLIALSPLGVSSGRDMLRYLTTTHQAPRAWFYEHLQATLGAGVAFHTAFAVFGSRRLFDLPTSGVWSLLPWVLPIAIGLPATLLWERHYRRRFGDALPRRGGLLRRPGGGVQSES